MTDEDRATARAIYSRSLGGPGCLAYLLVVLFSLIGLMVVALPSAAVFPNAAPAIVIFADLVGLIAIQLIVIHTARIPKKRRHKLQSVRRLEAALTRGTMIVIDIVSDAAWTDLGSDDDAPAILFRVGQGQYAYINNSWLNDLPTFDRSEEKRFPARTTLRTLDEEWRGLSVQGEGEEIEVRDDLGQLPESRDITNRNWPKILEKPEHWGTPLLELSDADMPASWLPVLRRP